MMDENVRKREIDASRSLNVSGEFCAGSLVINSFTLLQTAAAATERYSADVANSNTSRTHQKYK